MAAPPFDAQGRAYGYVVFCRLCDLADMAADHLAQTVTAFDRVLNTALEGVEGAQRFSSPYGGGVVVWERVRGALDVAQRLIEGATAAGVRVAVGLNAGPAARTNDVLGHTLIGSAINVAARLATVTAMEGHTAACRAFVEEAQQGLTYTRHDFFAAPVATQVKRTRFIYSPIIAAGFAQPSELAIPEVSAIHEPQNMHVLLYDLAHFSELLDGEQRPVVERLTIAVQATEVTMGRNLLHETELWYAPAGDGGALIWRAHLGTAAWTFATALQAQSALAGLDLRIGLHRGQMVARPDGIPVGPAVLGADRASAQAPTGGLAVTRTFWKALRDQDRAGWQEQPVEDAPDLLRVFSIVHHTLPQSSQQSEAQRVERREEIGEQVSTRSTCSGSASPEPRTSPTEVDPSVKTNLWSK